VPDLVLHLNRSGAGVAVALTSCNAGRVQAMSTAAAHGVATALGGFFALSAGQAWGPGTVTTPQLAANASAADVAAAVTALPGVGGVTATHVPGPSGVGVGLYSCLVTLAPAAGAGASPPPLFAEGRWLTGVGGAEGRRGCLPIRETGPSLRDTASGSGERSVVRDMIGWTDLQGRHCSNKWLSSCGVRRLGVKHNGARRT
jgi:hypothetical protein